jgi:hypothetical protein
MICCDGRKPATFFDGQSLDSVLGQSVSVRSLGLSLDAADYDSSRERPAETPDRRTRAGVPKALLAQLPEGSRTFGYIVDDDGQLLVRTSEPERG